MPIKINEVSGGQFLVVHVWGKLVKADYERFLPRLRRTLPTPRKTEPIVRYDRFPGLGPERAVGEIKFDLRHAKDFERVATVGDKEWERVMALLIKPFTKAKTRYFDATQYASAPNG